MNDLEPLYGDLTTYGRNMGKPHKVELTFVLEEGKIYLLAHKRKTGVSTDWYHNLERNPECIFEISGLEYSCKAVSLGDNKLLEQKIRVLFEKKGGKSHYDAWYANSERIPVVLETVKVSC